MKLFDSSKEPSDFLSIYSMVIFEMEYKGEVVNKASLIKLKKAVIYYEKNRNGLYKILPFIEVLKNEVCKFLYKSTEIEEVFVKIKKYPSSAIAVSVDDL